MIFFFYGKYIKFEDHKDIVFKKINNKFMGISNAIRSLCNFVLIAIVASEVTEVET
jgi:hypothetical protein